MIFDLRKDTTLSEIVHNLTDPFYDISKSLLKHSGYCICESGDYSPSGLYHSDLHVLDRNGQIVEWGHDHYDLLLGFAESLLSEGGWSYQTVFKNSKERVNEQSDYMQLILDLCRALNIKITIPYKVIEQWEEQGVKPMHALKKLSKLDAKEASKNNK